MTLFPDELRSAQTDEEKTRIIVEGILRSMGFDFESVTATVQKTYPNTHMQITCVLVKWVTQGEVTLTHQDLGVPKYAVRFQYDLAWSIPTDTFRRLEMVPLVTSLRESVEAAMNWGDTKGRWGDV